MIILVIFLLPMTQMKNTTFEEYYDCYFLVLFIINQTLDEVNHLSFIQKGHKVF